MTITEPNSRMRLLVNPGILAHARLAVAIRAVSVGIRLIERMPILAKRLVAIMRSNAFRAQRVFSPRLLFKVIPPNTGAMGALSGLGWLTNSRIVTHMVDREIGIDLSVVKQVSVSMGHYHRCSIPCLPVTLRDMGSCPDPAFIPFALHNFFPEAFIVSFLDALKGSSSAKALVVHGAVAVPPLSWSIALRGFAKNILMPLMGSHPSTVGKIRLGVN